MSNIRLTLDTRRAKKDGSYPLVFRITTNGESRDIATGYSSHASDWNTKAQKLRKSHKGYADITSRLNELESKYRVKMVEYERRNEGQSSIQELRNFILSKQVTTTTVYQFWFEEIERLKKINRHGAARVSKCALDVLHKVKSLDVAFEKIDYNYLIQVETVLQARSVKANSISVYFRALRAILNRAINLNLSSPVNYPFKAFRIKKEPTLPRVLPLDEIQKYFQLPIEPESRLYESWMIGKLIFLLAGINVSDLLQLTKENLKAGRVIYLRSKTKRMYSVKVLPHTEEIVSYFACKERKTLCGMLTDEQLENKARLPFVIHQRIKILNKHLKKISEEFGFSEVITSYTFRYTVANVCKQLGYNVQLIAELLGHSYGNRVTGIYLEAYDLELIDQMNMRIAQTVLDNGVELR